MSALYKKYSLAGNAFLLTESAPDNPGQVAVTLCNDRLGLGADGLLFYKPDKTGTFGLLSYAPDGAGVPVGTDAVFCACAHAAFLHPGLHDYRFGGIRGETILYAEKNGDTVHITAVCGKADFAPAATGAVTGQEITERMTELGRRILRLTAVSIVRPWAVCFVSDFGETDTAYLGTRIHTQSLFRNGAEAVFVCTEEDGSLSVRTHLTHGDAVSGSAEASAAAVAAACRLGKIPYNRETTVHNSGGDISVLCTDNGTVLLQSDVLRVCSAEA